MARATIDPSLLEEIVRLAPASIAIWRGPELRLEYINPEYEKSFPGRELVGKRLLEAFPEITDQSLPTLMKRVFDTGEPYNGREVMVRHRRHEGGPLEEHYYDFAYRRIDGADGKPYGVFAFTIDVTARVAARLGVLRANAELNEERELRDRFVALLSHDLRNPLAVAKMSTYLAIAKAGQSHSMIEHASKALEAINRVDRMLRDLLDVSRIRAGAGLRLEIAECDLASIVRSACDEMTGLHGAEYRIRGPSYLAGYWSCGDILRALENLASHAARHGDLLRPITVTLEPRDAEVAVLVHYHGQPIPPNDLPTLFESFRRSPSGAAEQGGSLGLSLVRGVAEAHGGSVEVESGEDRGTTFTMRLPYDSRRYAA